MRVEVFRAAHVDALELQPTQARWRDRLTPERLQALEGTNAWTGFAGRRPVACAGLLDLGEGRAEAWSMLAADAGASMTALTRALMRGLAAAGFRHVQMTTEADFPPAGRWAAMLGFRRAGRLTRWLADGRDVEIWERVDGWE
jgi:hypothetical protein